MTRQKLAPLTDRQAEVLDAIACCIRERGYPPTVREIGRRVGLSSSSTVHAHLDALRAKGYIKTERWSPRTITVVER